MLLPIDKIDKACTQAIVNFVSEQRPSMACDSEFLLVAADGEMMAGFWLRRHGNQQMSAPFRMRKIDRVSLLPLQ